MLTRDLIAKVRTLEITTRRLVEELTCGAYQSVFKGRGIEFSEVREYLPGDDVRDIDWNVTARTGTPYIKKYSEERELTVILAVDVSSSLYFGTGEENKHDRAAGIAALLAFSAIRSHDKVGLLLFSDKTELWIPPRSGKSHVMRLLREMVAFEPKSAGTDLASAMDSLEENLKKRSVIFMISDFLSPEPFEKEMKILNRKHDVVAIRILDGLELSLPALPGLEVEDAETGSHLFLDASSASVRENYRMQADHLLESRNETFRHARVDVVDLRCNEDLVKPLMVFFRSRGRKRRFA